MEKEHQLKIFANEFIPVGFNIKHKQRALEQYSNELLDHMEPTQTHKFYWEKVDVTKINQSIQVKMILAYL